MVSPVVNVPCPRCLRAWHGREAEALEPRTLSLGAPGIAGKTEGSFFSLPARQRAWVHRNDERRRIGSDYDLASPQRKERDNDDDCSSACARASPLRSSSWNTRRNSARNCF